MKNNELLAKQITGLLLGTAVGDAIGLPREGLTAKRASKLFGNKLQHNLIVTPWGRYGLCSDDTEHALLVAESLLGSANDPDIFLKTLAKKMRNWCLALPAGIGMATLKACLKLLVGISPQKSGIKSAGNGPAMRAAIIGWYYADNPLLMERFVNYSTQITHNDPKALEGAWVIAKVASYLVLHQPTVAPVNELLDEVLITIKGEELREYLQLAKQKLQEQASLADYIEVLGLTKRGITGYINYTVSAVIYAWLRYFGNYRQTITALVAVGGDTDTTAAIAGALVGITCGVGGIPKDWLVGVREWPANKLFINKLVMALLAKKWDKNDQVKVPNLFWPLLLVRNVAFLLIIMLHGFRRLLPPY